MSDDYKRGYSKGYSARANHWPLHRPPVPPQPIIAALMIAAQELRDAADTVCATFDEDDPLVLSLSPKIDLVDCVMSEISEWLRKSTATDGPQKASASLDE